ncbi:hypothetical protein NCU10056 [Neurospora crassa OR74A]|uniref:Uncharacterized protein n=1 Tax=Neurospora crassa (strain ATCC 24698 / 74-OR23-1A / CBS 708.71 / DSM 1257 / FGSC 987) TaxID=367110 RepID=Q7S3W8_NEUCR|nr:hypothetical protein NCU10056 [Neurospora crassa OR74A]EAA30186.3 hypothetical protein NCU10056 [Neurospora crassa OR74A]|eukprot:XP_959422.3 hypothetical protein NCU10056 [Neurospora crassa OR74A]
MSTLCVPQLSDASNSTALGLHNVHGDVTTHRNAGSGYSEPRPFAAKLQGATGHEQVSSGPDGQFKALALFQSFSRFEFPKPFSSLAHKTDSTHTTMKLSGGKGAEESRNSPSQDDKTKSVAKARQRVPLAGTIQN